VLEAVKVWPGKNGAFNNIGATANLDSFLRAPTRARGLDRDEETGSRIKQRN
jgi:hypothetical protein